MKASYWKYKLPFTIKISSYIKTALLPSPSFSQNGISDNSSHETQFKQWIRDWNINPLSFLFLIKYRGGEVQTSLCCRWRYHDVISPNFRFFPYLPWRIVTSFPSVKTWIQTILYGIEVRFIIEYLKLEGTHTDHRVQLPAPHRTT